MQVAPKPVKFTICQEETIDGLTNAVNRWLSQGFQPHGDLHIHIVAGQGTVYTQAMIKVELRPMELPADLQQSSSILVPRPQIVP